MKYALYCIELKRGEPTEHFVNAASQLLYLRKDRNTLMRWLEQMSIPVPNPTKTSFAIYEDGVKILVRAYLSSGRNASWTTFKEA